jgi:hypothetical protein
LKGFNPSVALNLNGNNFVVANNTGDHGFSEHSDTVARLKSLGEFAPGSQFLASMDQRYRRTNFS